MKNMNKKLNFNHNICFKVCMIIEIICCICLLIVVAQRDKEINRLNGENAVLISDNADLSDYCIELEQKVEEQENQINNLNSYISGYATAEANTICNK